MHMAVTSVRPCSVIVLVLEARPEAQDEIIVADSSKADLSAIGRVPTLHYFVLRRIAVSLLLVGRDDGGYVDGL
jgi:hypothetical protein